MTSIKNRAKELSNIPLFAGISLENLNNLLYCTRSFEEQYRKDDVIFLEAEEISYLGIILSGSVLMMKDDIYGNQTMLSYMTTGELFGETFAVRKERECRVTFIAGSPTRVLFLAVNNLIHTCPNGCAFHNVLTTNFFNLLGRKNEMLLEKIVIQSKTTIREKILAYLSLLAEQQDSRYVTLPITKTAMAGFLSVNRSAMMRELSNMKKEGIIDYQKDTFRILVASAT